MKKYLFSTIIMVLLLICLPLPSLSSTFEVMKYYCLAHRYLKDGMFKEAIQMYQKGLALEPYNAKLHFNLALAFRKMDMIEEAIKEYKTVIILEPDNACALNNLAWLYATTTNITYRDPEKAIEYALRAVELTGRKDIEKLDTLAEAYFRNGQKNMAIETINEALSLKPRNQYLQQQLERFQSSSPATFSGEK